jgi:hypothetical protein
MGFIGRKLTEQERAEELFSPYIDGQVTAEELRFLERYLAGHPDARDKFETLKAAVQLTRTLPSVKAPRSFVLPRSLARQPSLALRLYPAMRLATVAAMALFAFALFSDLSTSARLAAPLADRNSAVVARSNPTETATQVGAEAASAPVPAPTELPATEMALAAIAPTPASTATALNFAQDAAANTTATPAGTLQPPAAAELAAPTEAAAETEDRSRMDGAAVTPKAASEESAEATMQAISNAPLTVVDYGKVDALRLAVFGLAGLTAVLAAATLVVWRRIR